MAGVWLSSRKHLAPLGVLCLSLALAACGTDSKAPAGSTTESSGPAKGESVLSVRPPKGPPPKRLIVKDLTVGRGPRAKAGERITVQYVGVAYRTGKPFDYRTRSEPFNFELGVGDVQAGWDKGVPGMKVGGRRELIIPPRLTENELGRPETLIYVIELLEVDSPGDLAG